MTRRVWLDVNRRHASARKNAVVDVPHTRTSATSRLQDSDGQKKAVSGSIDSVVFDDYETWLRTYLKP